MPGEVGELPQGKGVGLCRQLPLCNAWLDLAIVLGDMLRFAGRDPLHALPQLLQLPIRNDSPDDEVAVPPEEGDLFPRQPHTFPPLPAGCSPSDRRLPPPASVPGS